MRPCVDVSPFEHIQVSELLVRNCMDTRVSQAVRATVAVSICTYELATDRSIVLLGVRQVDKAHAVSCSNRPATHKCVWMRMSETMLVWMWHDSYEQESTSHAHVLVFVMTLRVVYDYIATDTEQLRRHTQAQACTHAYTSDCPIQTHKSTQPHACKHTHQL